MKMIKIGTSHCGPCKMQDRELKSLKDIEVEYVDADENEEYLTKFDVTTVPTTVIVDDDLNILHRFSGLTKANVINEVFQSLS